MLSVEELTTWLHERAAVRAGESLTTVPNGSGPTGTRSTLFVRGDGSGLVVKQARDDFSRQLLSREAWFYRTVEAAEWRSTALRDHLERLIAWDDAAGILAITAHIGAVDPQPVASDPSSLAPTVGRRVGSALATLHSVPAPHGAEVSTGPPGRPWRLLSNGQSTRPPLEPAITQFLVDVRQLPEVRAIVAAVESTWSPTVLIHGDIRWDNWLAERQADAPLRLIDWETVRRGDPRWDVGCALAAYVVSWVRSIPHPPEREQVLDPRLAGIPITRLRPSIKALCASYVSARAMPADEAESLLDSCVPFIAARLILCAGEDVAAAGGPTRVAVALARIARNLQQDPRAARRLLLGEPIP